MASLYKYQGYIVDESGRIYNPDGSPTTRHLQGGFSGRDRPSTPYIPPSPIAAPPSAPPSIPGLPVSPTNPPGPSIPGLPPPPLPNMPGLQNPPQASPGTVNTLPLPSIPGMDNSINLPGSTPISPVNLPGNLPVTPNTPGLSPALPYPGENQTITQDPNQQAIINQQQMQGNLINQVMQQIPNLIATEQAAQQNTAQNALKQSSDLYGQQQSSLEALLNQRRQNAEQALTTGPEGEAFRQQYNKLGLLDSGVFNTGLAQQFSDIQKQSDLATGALGLEGLQNQQGILNSLYGTNSNLGLSGLNNVLGLQQQGIGTINDLGTSGLSELFGQQNASAAQAFAQSLANQQQNQQRNAATGNLIGGGLGAGAGALIGMPGGPAGMLLGGSLGGQLGGNLGNSAGSTWICSHLKKKGLATAREVLRVHRKLIPSIFLHPIDWLRYHIFAPVFIMKAEREGFDFESIKKRVIDDIILTEDCEEAFQKYRSVCKELMPWAEPLLLEWKED